MKFAYLVERWWANDTRRVVDRSFETIRIYIHIDKFRFEMVGQDNIFQDGIYDDCLVLIEYACETAAMIL